MHSAQLVSPRTFWHHGIAAFLTFSFPRFHMSKGFVVTPVLLLAPLLSSIFLLLLAFLSFLFFFFKVTESHGFGFLPQVLDDPPGEGTIIIKGCVLNIWENIKKPIMVKLTFVRVWIPTQTHLFLFMGGLISTYFKKIIEKYRCGQFWSNSCMKWIQKGSSGSWKVGWSAEIAAFPMSSNNPTMTTKQQML